MIETIAIFDEYSQSPQELTAELRHKKRMALDPLIYDLLKHNYGAKLDAFWKTHSVPTKTDSYLILIERRIHPNLAFVLMNAAYFARTWGIVLICSDLNYEYCKDLCKGKDIEIRPLFQGNPDPAQGKSEYNSLLKSAEFYRSLPGEVLLLIEMDTYLRKPVPEEWKQYDLVAAPYEWDEESVGGGLSCRKRQAMIRICSEISDTSPDQDVYLCSGARALGYRIPPFELGVQWISESCLYEDPVGVHQWWTFFFPKQTDDAEEIFHALLSLEIE